VVAPSALAQSHHPAKPTHGHGATSTHGAKHGHGHAQPKHHPAPKPPAPSRLQATTLVSSDAGTGILQDPTLSNGWGLSIGPKTAAWVSSMGQNQSEVYDGGVNGTPARRVTDGVSVPLPTGQTFNSTTSGFPVSANGQTAPSRFIFSSVTGAIFAWNGAIDGTVAQSVAQVPGAAFTGVTIDGDQLYAADFAGNQIDVFDANFQPVQSPTGAFTDPKLPGAFSAFGVQSVANVGIVVTYAEPDPVTHIDIHAPHAGIVDIYDHNGKLLRRLDTGRTLNAPWGVALAPRGLGTDSGQLLIANFGDGRIQAYNAKTGKFDGQLLDGTGKPLTIPGIWGIAAGTDRVGGPNSLLYAAGTGPTFMGGAFGKITLPTRAPTAPGSPGTPGY
jgi:uncharacterized protein (TIGR03118 family)